MATTFSYRCTACGYEYDRKFSGRPPEALKDEDHPAGTGSRMLCHGQMRRVWGNQKVNLGYQAVKHNSSQHWLFNNA